MTRYGHVRNVFYSDTAAPIIEELISENADEASQELNDIANEKGIKNRLANKHLARRFEKLLDLTEINKY